MFKNAIKTKAKRWGFALCVAALISCAFFAAISSAVSSTPDQTSPAEEKVEDTFYFGVGIHLGQMWNKAYSLPVEVSDRLSDLGVNAMRDDIPWEAMKAKTQDNLKIAVPKLAGGLKIIDAKPVLIIKGDPKIFPEIQPASDASRKKYTDFVLHSVDLFKNYDPILEIWNEWNMKASEDKNLGSAETYVALAKAAYPAIKAKSPGSIVLVGSPGNDRNDEWILHAARLGLLDYGDALSIHPYNFCAPHSPRTGWHALVAVKTLQKRLREQFPDKNLPIYITEIGWPDQNSECAHIPLDQIAENIAQILLEAPTLPWLKGVWIYELFDQRNISVERENYFGLYDLRKQKKPAACAAQTVWDFIRETSSPKLTAFYWKTNFASFDTSYGTKRVAVWDMEPGPETRRWVKFPETATFKSLCGRTVPKAGEWYQMGPAPVLAELPASDYRQIQFKTADGQIIPQKNYK